jgi:hypothetical protein
MNRFEKRQEQKQKRIASGKPFITADDLRRFGPRSAGSAKMRDLLAKSSLTPGQIYFMRFVGVQTEKQWIIDDRYRQWSKGEFSLRANLRQRYAEGAQRMMP